VEPASSPSFLRHKEGCTIDDYQLLVRIGEGTFGEVWKAERFGSHVALKILKTSMTSEETQRELKSLETLRALRNAYLLHTENFWSDGDRLYIEMELADGGTLKERLRAYQAAGQRAIPETELLKFFSEAAQGLDYLHDQRPLFLHRDVKPANILLVKGCAKLGDFGLLRQVAGDHSSTKTQGGTFPYMAPESIASDLFSPATDLFSFAVSYVELRQGELPFPGKNQYQICERILRAAPALSDIFHPDERRVLERALEKEPEARFRSCGEFVFELNRVVPWTAATTIPEMAPVRLPEPSLRTPRTPSNKLGAGSHRPEANDPAVTDPGTSRKQPMVTMPELVVALPDAPGTPAELPTRDAPNVSARRLRGSLPAARTATAIEIAPTPPVRPSRMRSRVLAAIAGAVVLLVGIVGIWLVLSSNAQRAVQGLIASKKYPEALAAIQAANPLILTDARQLHDEVETGWFAELHEPGQAETLETLKKSLRELDQFEAAFPGRDNARVRRGLLQQRLHDTLSADLDDCLAGRQFDAARALVNRYDSLLADHGKAFQARINAAMNPTGVAKKEDVAPKTIDTAAADSALAAAWQELLAAKVMVDASQRAVQQARGRLSMQTRPTRGQKLNLQAIELLLHAHESPGALARKSVPELIALLSDGEVGGRMWTGLVPLDRAKELLDIDDLARLPTPPADGATKKAAGELFAAVLERRLRQDNFGWQPNRSQMERILEWCTERIGTTTGDLAALRAECILETGGAAAKINEIGLPNPDNWYTAYVRALIQDRTQDSAHAADTVAEIVTKDAKAIHPDARTKHAIAIVRRAVDALPRQKGTGKQFATNTDAAKACRWLKTMLTLDERTDPKYVADLAVAAVQVDDPTTSPMLLDTVEKQVAARGERDKTLAAVVGAYQLQLQLAAGDLDAGRNKEARSKAERSGRFALAWKDRNLKDAADLYATAIDLEARADGDTVTGEAKGQAWYGLCERDLAKAGNSKAAAFLRVAEMDIAFSRECTLAVLTQLIAEGQKTMDLAAQEHKRAQGAAAQEWWAQVRGNGLVKLADLRVRSLTERTAQGIVADSKAELTEIRTLYENGRELKGYTERWRGELAFKIGFVHWKLKQWKEAGREFRDSLKSLKTMPEPYPEAVRADVLQFRQFMQAELPKLPRD
jgi:serine/threonine protein kinase